MRLGSRLRLRSERRGVVILGIDPGTATTGYGLVTEDEAGDARLALRRHHHRAGRPHAGAAAGDRP